MLFACMVWCVSEFASIDERMNERVDPAVLVVSLPHILSPMKPMTQTSLLCTISTTTTTTTTTTTATIAKLIQEEQKRNIGAYRKLQSDFRRLSASFNMNLLDVNLFCPLLLKLSFSSCLQKVANDNLSCPISRSCDKYRVFFTVSLLRFYMRMHTQYMAF